MKNFKRLLSAFLAVIMCISVIPMSVFAAAEDGLGNFTKRNSYEADLFSDVSESNWFYDNVKTAYELGLMVGKGENTFDTESGLTIAETVTIAARIHSIYHTGDDSFEKSTPWYGAYVDYAKANDVLTYEVSDYTKAATRAEFALILANALPDEALESANKVAANAIPDVKTSDSFGDAVYKLYRAGIMVGNDENGTFAPASNIKRSEVSAIVTRMADRTLRRAVQLGEEYTVSFDMNGHGSQISAQTVFEGDAAVKPSDPKANNYKFKGWYTSEGKLFDFSAPITGDVTLRAAWETTTNHNLWLPILGELTRTFTVKFESNGGSAVADQTVMNGKTVTMPANPTKDNYNFVGWYTDAALTAEYDFTTAVSKSTKLYAKWDAIVVKNEFTVTFDGNGEGVTNVPTSQTVKKGECAEIPEWPERTGYTFVGWYTDATFAEYFDFTAAVNEDYTLVARWVDTTDTTDTDGDKLSDSVEDYYGTDKTKPDTDGDELSDYVEVAILNLDPLKVDTDVNGVNDGDEDSDDDGITNVDEINNGTDPTSKDTDSDGLADNVEVTYNTNPILADTDDDGVSDGKEIELGTDPLVAQTTFNMNVSAEDDGNGAKASVQIELSGEQVETLSVEAVENDTFFPETMPGYMGKAYDFNVDGEFETATISFEFDLSTLASDADPVIYYFNEDEQKLEELETTINGNVASAEVTHFSKYILVNRKVYQDSFTWQDVWENEHNFTDIEIVFVVDDSGSMWSNDPSDERLTVARTLIDNLPTDSKIGLVRFDGYSPDLLTPELTKDKEAVKDFLTNKYFFSSGGTDMYAGIQKGFPLFEATEDTTLKMMIVLSDGATSDTNLHSTVVSKANEENIRIYTVGLGSSTSYFNNYLKPLANNTGAVFYLASDATQLADIYKDISEKIDIETDSDEDGVPDYYEDNMILFNGVKLVLDKNNPDTDGDGLLDGEEVVITKKYNDDKTQVIVTGKLELGDPTKSDTDDDGIVDVDDTAPLTIGLKGGIIGTLTIVSCYTDPYGEGGWTSGHAFLIHNSYVNNELNLEQFISGCETDTTWDELKRVDSTNSKYILKPNSYLSIGGFQSKFAFSESSSGDGNGIYYNLEFYKYFNEGITYLKNSALTYEITYDQLKTLVTYVSLDSVNYWSAGHNCSSIACDSWNMIYSTNLTAKGLAGWHLFDTPTALKNSILKQNGSVKDYKISEFLDAVR